MKSVIKCTMVHDNKPYNLDINFSTFTGGEINVVVPDVYTSSKLNHISVNALIKDSDGIMAVLLLKDAIHRTYGFGVKVYLVLKYIPYARQDRVCNVGEPLSIKVFADIINNANFSKVFISDPHSDVSSALFNNVEIITQLDLFTDWYNICTINIKDYVIVSPDAGAIKKSMKVAQHYNIPLICAEKIRNMKTMEIEKTVVHMEPNTVEKTIIIDDICDGGRTFIELAKVLKNEKGVKQVDLFVTNGIFSYGKEKILEIVDNIYTIYDWTIN